MKNNLIVILMCLVTLSCSTKKKTEKVKETIIKTHDLDVKETANSTKEIKTDSQKKENESSNQTETTITYKPKKNEATGLYEPFEMQNGSQSVKINGNGDVVIKYLATELTKQATESKQQIETVKSVYEAIIKERNEQLKDLSSKLFQKDSRVLWLYLVIFILICLLALSVYFHFVKPKVPLIRN